MNVYLGIWLSIFFGISCLNVHAQSINARWIPATGGDSMNAHIQIQEVSLKVDAPKGTQILWPTLKDSIGNMEILSAGELLRQSLPQTDQYSQDFSLLIWQKGDALIPSLEVQGVAPSGDTLSAFAQAVVVDANVQLADTTQQFEPIKPVQDAPWTTEELVTWALTFLFLAILVGLGIYVWMRRKRQQPIIPVAPTISIPPYEKAMRKLAILESEKKWQEGDIKGYYVALTQILREYIEGAFQFPAMESVTDEIMLHIDDQHLPGPLGPQLKELLRQADYAKFAKSHPDPQTNMNSLDFARRFVKDTTSFLKRKAKEEAQLEDPISETQSVIETPIQDSRED